MDVSCEGVEEEDDGEDLEMCVCVSFSFCVCLLFWKICSKGVIR